jgi:hypothetical protein
MRVPTVEDRSTACQDRHAGGDAVPRRSGLPLRILLSSGTTYDRPAEQRSSSPARRIAPSASVGARTHSAGSGYLNSPWRVPEMPQPQEVGHGPALWPLSRPPPTPGCGGENSAQQESRENRPSVECANEPPATHVGGDRDPTAGPDGTWQDRGVNRCGAGGGDCRRTSSLPLLPPRPFVGQHDPERLLVSIQRYPHDPRPLLV